jgi:hypothetical protein
VLGDGVVEVVDVEGEHGLPLGRRLLRPSGEGDDGERKQQRDPGLRADRHGRGAVELETRDGTGQCTGSNMDEEGEESTGRK